MQRPPYLLLGAGLLALLSLPAAQGQDLQLDLDPAAPLEPATGAPLGVPGPVVGLGIPVELPAGGPLNAEAVGVPLPASEPPAAASLSDGPAGGSPQIPLGPEARRAATAATAATGIALAVALVLHQSGKLGAAGLLVPLFSRIQSNHLLDNEVRHRVHAAVEANPGVTIKEITQLCAIGWGTAVYHLKRLETERLIVSERRRQFRRFYKNGGGIVNDAKAAYGELKNPTTARIAEAILASPGRCQKEVCAAVGISPPLAHKYLARLAEAGLVDAQREWKTVKYFPTPKLEDLMLVARPPVAVIGPVPLAAAA